MTRTEAFITASALILAPLFKVAEFVALPALYRPDFLIVLAVAVGWSSDVWSAAPASFALGLMEDLFVGRVLGQRAVSLAAAGVVASLLKTFVSPDSALSKIIAAAVSACAADLASFVILRARGVGVGAAYLARWILPVSVAWSVILVLPLEALTRRFARLMSSMWPAGARKTGERAT